MRQIYLATPGGQQEVYPEEQVRAMWRQGVLSQDVLYWQQGMTDWRPLREYLALPAAMPPPLLPRDRFTEQAGYAFTKDPAALTSFVLFMIWMNVGMDFISLLSDFAQLKLAAMGSFGVSEAAANDNRQMVIGIITVIVYIVTAVGFLKWVHRANLNARGFGATDMKFTPGWSVGWYFIPFANLVKPYQAMREIWRASTNPLNWKSVPGSALLGWWWALWLITNLVNQVSFRAAQEVDSPHSLEMATTVAIVASIVDIPLCVVAITMISAIRARQNTLVYGTVGP